VTHPANSIGVTLQAGEYDVTPQCINGFDQTVFDTFTTAMIFDSPDDVPRAHVPKPRHPPRSQGRG
jgi:hypothetical protein